MSDIQKPRVLAVAEGMVPSVELVLSRPLEFLAGQGLLDFTFKLMSDGGLLHELDRCDLLLMMRACQPGALDLVCEANERHIPVVYAIDDDFQTLDPKTPLGKYYLETNAWDRLLQICGRSSQVWAFSETLKAKIIPIQANVVVPPAIASLDIIDKLRPQKTAARISDRRIIGYAATINHVEDIEYVAPVLLRLLKENDFLEVELVGVHSKSLAKHPRVRHFESIPRIEDYYRFVLTRDWDIGIAPLLRSPSNDAKTDNKYREYAAIGVSGVYSNAPPYWRSIIDGHNGIVANDLPDWHAALTKLLQHGDYAKRIAMNARADVELRYGIHAVSQRYLQYLRSVLSVTTKVFVIAGNIATTDIDIVRPFHKLAAEGRIEWLVMEGTEVEPADLEWADVLVVSRTSDKAALDAVRSAKSEYKIPVVFTWDDDFFVIPESIGAVAAHHREPTIVAGLEEILRTADLVKASSARIAERSRLYSKRVVQYPYGFDFAQLDGAHQAVKPLTSGVVIGFFGSAGHSAVLESILGALHRVAKLSPDVSFEFFGLNSDKLRMLPRTTFIPFSQSANESLKMLRSRKWDIGLAPLEVNDFNRAKLPTKYRDYGACQIAGIYTKIDPYESVVREGQTGLLVDNTEDGWVTAILSLVNDPVLRRNIAAQAHVHVRNELGIDAHVESWREVLDMVLPVQVDGILRDDKHRQKIRRLEGRLDSLTRQVEVLKYSARELLLAHDQAPAARTRLKRLTERAMRKLMPPARAALTPVPPGSLVKDFAKSLMTRPRGEIDDLEFGTGENLQNVLFVDYEVKKFPLRGAVLRVAFAATVPTLGGLVGVEVISPAGEIVHHVTTSIENLDPELLADFLVNDLEMSEAGWRVRLFARGSPSPIYVRTCVLDTVSGEPLPLFTLVDKA